MTPSAISIFYKFKIDQISTLKSRIEKRRGAGNISVPSILTVSLIAYILFYCAISMLIRITCCKIKMCGARRFKKDNWVQSNLQF